VVASRSSSGLFFISVTVEFSHNVKPTVQKKWQVSNKFYVVDS